MISSIITETESNAVSISTLYSEGSAASGALFSFVFLTEDGGVDFNRSALLVLDRNTSLDHTLPFNLHPGHYRVYVYDIESNGLLLNGVGYPAVTIDLCLDSNNNSLSKPANYILPLFVVNSSSHGLIWARCIYRKPSTVGFQITAQLSNASEVHQLLISQSTDPRTPVTVEVEKDGLYQVSIFAIRPGRGIVDSAAIFVEQVMVVRMPNIKTTPTTNELGKQLLIAHHNIEDHVDSFSGADTMDAVLLPQESPAHLAIGN